VLVLLILALVWLAGLTAFVALRMRATKPVASRRLRAASAIGRRTVPARPADAARRWRASPALERPSTR
jgi:hypothetical protein